MERVINYIKMQNSLFINRYYKENERTGYKLGKKIFITLITDEK